VDQPFQQPPGCAARGCGFCIHTGIPIQTSVSLLLFARP
jgi:hypothetical protein